jgi:hypothetical protein
MNVTKELMMYTFLKTIGFFSFLDAILLSRHVRNSRNIAQVIHAHSRGCIRMILLGFSLTFHLPAMASFQIHPDLHT